MVFTGWGGDLLVFVSGLCKGLPRFCWFWSGGGAQRRSRKRNRSGRTNKNGGNSPLRFCSFAHAARLVSLDRGLAVNCGRYLDIGV